MKEINWNPDKNSQLLKERNISFEDIVLCLQSNGLLDDLSHPNIGKYRHQRIFVINIDDYAYLVPYVESPDEIFLKTIIPSRKATKHYLGDKHHD
ncbi:MAG: BrnT family toxin [Methylophagaceae bacterium]